MYEILCLDSQPDGPSKQEDQIILNKTGINKNFHTKENKLIGYISKTLNACLFFLISFWKSTHHKYEM